MAGRFIVLLILVLAIDLYFFQAIRTIAKRYKPRFKRIAYPLYWLITITTLVYISLSVFFIPESIPKVVKTYLGATLFILYASKFLGCIVIILEDISRLFIFVFRKSSKKSREKRKNLSRSENHISRGRFISNTALLIGAIPLAPMLYGMIKGAFDYKTHNIDLFLPKLPNKFEGLKIVQISDLHLGSFTSTSPVEQIVSLINDQKPDIIFFTGDLVNYLSAEAEEFIPYLRRLSAKHGVFSILGNHDYGDYYQNWSSEAEKTANLERLKAIHKEVNWKLLLNENVILNEGQEKLAILGVENFGTLFPHFQRYGDIEKAKEGTERVPVKLLLSHDPSHWDEKIRGKHTDVDVMFSGHTHGAQLGIEIPGFKWSPVQYFYKQWAGLYKSDGQQLYVNRGIGFLGFPGRVGIRPEISVFRLTNQSA